MHKNVKQIRKAIYREQVATLEVLDEIAEIEREKLYLSLGWSSLYAMMTSEEMKYSEGAAMRRIHGARVIMKYPEVRGLLERREVSLCTLSLIARDLLKDGKKELIELIRGKSKREAEEALLLAGKKRVAPKREQVRVIVAPPPVVAHKEEALAKADELPLAPKQATSEQTSTATTPETSYRLTFTVSKEVYELVEELKAGMAHSLRGEREVLSHLFESGAKLLRKELKKKRTSSKDVPPPVGKAGSRYVPRELKRAVFERDGGCCQYRYQDGKKCGSEWGLELDHIEPFSRGGGTTYENLRVVCSAHNKQLAREAGLS